MNFADPLYFLLLFVLIPMIIWYIVKMRKSQASFRLSSTQGFSKIPEGARIRLRHLPFLFRILAIIFLIIAMARPQSSNSWSSSKTEGIDIMMSLDISSSMLAEDLKPNRLQAAKDVAASFISGRPNDNIGLVIFSAESFTQCPLTTDHSVLLNLLNQVQCGMIDDGTAIGHGIATSVDRLRNSHSKSKVIILLTDGSNNMGEIAPLTAAQIAKTFGIRIYTIGVGARGTAPYPFKTAAGIKYINIPADVDAKTLTQIADITGGKYFRATNTEALREIYKEIDKMEKTKLKTQQYSQRNEAYMPFAIIGLLCLLLGMLTKYTIFRNIP